MNELNNKMFELLNKYHKTGNETDEIKSLIEQGADIEARDKDNGATPLMYACGSYDYDKLGNGNLELARFLIAKGADINAKDIYGTSALSSATINGNVEITKLLIDNGANVNARDSQGITPLMDAQFTIKEKQQNAIKITKLLIENGAYLLTTDKQGKTALDYQNNKETFPFFNADIIDKSKNNEMITLLENAIEKADKQNRLNMALGEYIENGDLPNVKDCLDKGANENYLWLVAYNIRDYMNETKEEDRNPNYIERYLEIAECLLKNGQTIENSKDAKTFLESKEYLENLYQNCGVHFDFKENFETITKICDLLESKEIIQEEETQQEDTESNIRRKR